MNDPKELYIKLCKSQTMEMIIKFSGNCPVDIHSRESMSTVLSTASIDLVDALDNKRITFKNPEDHAMLVGLLTVCMKYASNDQLTKEATVQ